MLQPRVLDHQRGVAPPRGQVVARPERHHRDDEIRVAPARDRAAREPTERD